MPEEVGHDVTSHMINEHSSRAFRMRARVSATLAIDRRAALTMASAGEVQLDNFDAELGSEGRLDDHSDDEIRRIPETPPRPESDHAETEEGVEIFNRSSWSRFCLQNPSVPCGYYSLTSHALLLLFLHRCFASW